MSGARVFSPWWALLAAPVALAVGWVAGGMPVPVRRAPEPREAVAPAPRRTPPSAASPIEVQSTLRTVAATPGPEVAVSPLVKPDTSTAPEPPPPPPDPRTRAIFSEWTTYDDALRQSRDTGKPVMLDFSADWCPPCQALKRELFDAAAMGTTVKSAVIPVSLVDRMRETGQNPPQIEDLQRRYGIQAFPTLIVFSPATGRSLRLQGYAGATETLRWITEAAAALR